MFSKQKIKYKLVLTLLNMLYYKSYESVVMQRSEFYFSGVNIFVGNVSVKIEIKKKNVIRK